MRPSWFSSASAWECLDNIPLRSRFFSYKSSSIHYSSIIIRRSRVLTLTALENNPRNRRYQFRLGERRKVGSLLGNWNGRGRIWLQLRHYPSNCLQRLRKTKKIKKNCPNTKLKVYQPGPPLWSSGQSSWLEIQRSCVRFPAQPDFLRSSWSTEPREDNWATWKESSGSGLENRN
jgi:hypothetical protein